MTTEARSEASRQNGAKSNGPTTREGKTISSANSLRHGLTAKAFLFDSEDPEKFFNLSGLYYENLVPTDELERDLVDEMVTAKWRLRRDRSNETAMFEIEMDRKAKKREGQPGPTDHAVEYAHALRALADESKSVHLLIRYENTHRRSYYKALTTLLDLRAELKKNPVPVEPPVQPPAEPEPEPVQPEQNQNVSQPQPPKKDLYETNPRNDERPAPETATNGENSKIDPAQS